MGRPIWQRAAASALMLYLYAAAGLVTPPRWLRDDEIVILPPRRDER